MDTTMLRSGLVRNVGKDEERFYGGYLPLFLEAIDQFVGELEEFQFACTQEDGHDPIARWQARIKSRDSMVNKLRRQGLEPTRANAVCKVFDAAGVRVICPFVDDVDAVATAVRTMPGFVTKMEKDYMRRPKANGYRSYHMILSACGDDFGVWLEVQIRTIAMDCWANIEHQLKYKRGVPQEATIASELKRYADEMASIDLSLQTLADLASPTTAGGGR